MDTEQTSNNISTMDVPVVFIKPEYGQSQNKISRVKRATVVGNPMFSSTVEDDNDNEECLSLDDLDMDYEQIMHYFDNLKVRIVYIYVRSRTNFRHACLKILESFLIYIYNFNIVINMIRK